MKKLVMATAAVLGLGIGTPTYAASEIDCMVMWNKADANNSGTLEGNEATTYLDIYDVKVVGQGLDACPFAKSAKAPL